MLISTILTGVTNREIRSRNGRVPCRKFHESMEHACSHDLARIGPRRFDNRRMSLQMPYPSLQEHFHVKCGTQSVQVAPTRGLDFRLVDLSQH